MALKLFCVCVQNVQWANIVKFVKLHTTVTLVHAFIKTTFSDKECKLLTQNVANRHQLMVFLIVLDDTLGISIYTAYYWPMFYR